MTQRQTLPPTQLIPEFCRGRPLLMLVIVMELLAAVLTLAANLPHAQEPLHLLLLSVYVQWIGICSAAVLCLARRWLHMASVTTMFLICWSLLVLVIYLSSELAWWMLRNLPLGPLPQGTRGDFLLRGVMLGAIVALLLLRYFWERNQWLEQTRAESEARYLALQARIHPHFLFNALNSLAELIRSKPQRAETMVEDLADLFRVSLDARSRLVPLREEIETVKGYLRIEEVRLGDKLLVNWEIPAELMDAHLPRLIIQPLVENAVLHGVSRLRARGILHVIAQREMDELVVDVENPLPPADAPTQRGTGVAVTNIAQRIKLIYGNSAKLQLREDRDEFGPLYRARLRLPLQFKPDER